MAATNIAPEALLNYVPLTEPVSVVMAELPRPLPPLFYNQKNKVLGDVYRRFKERDSRTPARANVRGAPPLEVPQTPIYAQDVKCISSKETIGAGDEILKLFQKYNAYAPQDMAKEELARRGRSFGTRSFNLRTAAIHSMVALGKTYFDTSYRILPSSSGADTSKTIDYLVPAGNYVSSAVDWSSASADIPGSVATFLRDAMIAGAGRRPKYAICGANIQGYIAKNTNFQAYLARNQAFRDYFINNNWVADGVLELIWVRAQDCYFETESGTFPTQFPDDQITFFPDIDRDVYEFIEGSIPVPAQFSILQSNVTDFSSVVDQLMNNPVYGAYRYAYGQTVPTLQIQLVQGDTFFPDLKIPECVWFMDTKP